MEWLSWTTIWTWLSWAMIVVGVVGVFLLFFAFVFTFIRFTFVKEGTAKAIVRMNQRRKMVMAWRGFKLDENRKVVSTTDKPKWYGGLRFVGFWPFDKVYRYNFRWLGLELVEGKEEPKFHERILDYVLLKPDVYLLIVEAAETKPPERIPLTFFVLATISVINPEKVIFKAPSNWLENAMARLGALVRAWVATETLDDILLPRSSPESIWARLKNDPLITETFRDTWGIQVEENGIEIRNINFPPEYQAAAAKGKEMDLLAKGRAAEMVGTIIEMMAKARGKEAKDIQEEIEGDPELRKQFLALANDLVIRKMGMEARAYTDIRVIGAEGLERTLLNALAVWRRMPLGQTGQTETPKEREKSSEKPKKTQ